MPEIRPPQDHVEIAVEAAESQLRGVLAALYGTMKAADISGSGAFDRLDSKLKRDTKPDRNEIALTAMEFKAFQAVFDNIEVVRKSIGLAVSNIETARGRYTKTREEGELMKLLSLFEAEDTRTTK